MGIFGAAIKGFGKALSKGKKTKKVDKVQKSASAFVKRRKQLSGAAGGPKPKKTVDPVSKRLGISKEMKDALKFGTIAAVGLGASKTIKKNKPVKKAMGGEAAESVGRATVVKSQRDARRKLLDDSINRVYKKVSEAKKIGKIKPKKKPKNPNRIKPKTKPKKP